VDRLPEGVVGRQPPLVHRGRRERGETDDVADGVDVLDRCPVVLVHGEPAAPVRLEPDGGQVELLGHALAARGVHHRVGRDALAADQRGYGGLIRHVHVADLLAEPEGHRQVAQMELQRLHDLRIAELEHPLALLDHRDPAAQRGEQRRVLDPDHPGPDDHERRWDLLQLEYLVGVEHPGRVEVDLGRPRRPGAGGDHDDRRGHRRPVTAMRTLHGDGVRIEEPAGAGEQLDVVTQQLGAHHLYLAADHMLGARQQVGDRDVLLDPVARAVEVPLVHTGEVQHRFPQGIRRDRAVVDADAADHVLPVDDGHPLPQFRGRDGRLLPARAGADDDQVVVVVGHAPSLVTCRCPRKIPIRLLYQNIEFGGF
jgi:hypothetical protein